jgi:predicted oxidoreductase
MQRTRLNDHVELSRIAYGCWRLGDSPDTSAAATRRKIDLCLDQGITTFDHADIYGNYACEALFGQAVKADRTLAKKLEIVTKCGIMLMSDVHPTTRVKHYDTSAAHVRASVERSLSNLGVDVIDVLLIHRQDPLMDHAQLGACLDALIAQGKVKSAGVSNFMPWDVELLQAGMKNRLVTNQIEASLLHLAPFVDGQIAFAQRTKMPLMAWSPLAGGQLFGSGDAARRLAPPLAAKAKAEGVDATAVAIGWLLHHPANIIPVLGTNDLARITRIGDATEVKFDTQGWYELYAAALGRDVP